MQSTPRLGCTTATFGGALPAKLDAMRAAGFDSTELLPRDVYEILEGPDVVADMIRASGLSVSCYQSLRSFEGMPDDRRARKLAIAAQLFDQMRLFDCDTLVLCTSVDPCASSDRGRIADDLRELGELARRYGARVAWEPICTGRWVRDYRDAWAIVQQVDHPAIGLLLDAFHIFALEAPLEPIADIPADKIFMVEVSDYPQARLGWTETTRHFRLFPGEGITPGKDFIRQVQRTGYSGHYAVEVFNTHYRTLPPDGIAQRAMDSLRSLFEL